MPSAAKISPALLDEIERHAAAGKPSAEIWRRVAASAESRGLLRPSYERVRTLASAARRRQRLQPSTAEIALDVMTRARPPESLLDHVSGVGVPRRRR
jgi:hypothetical protein